MDAQATEPPTHAHSPMPARRLNQRGNAMSRIIGAAGAAVLGLSLVVGSVLPGFAQRGAIEQDPDIYFDLGIDATLLPQDAAGAKAYLAKQPADTQRVLR